MVAHGLNEADPSTEGSQNMASKELVEQKLASIPQDGCLQTDNGSTRVFSAEADENGRDWRWMSGAVSKNQTVKYLFREELVKRLAGWKPEDLEKLRPYTQEQCIEVVAQLNEDAQKKLKTWGLGKYAPAPAESSTAAPKKQRTPRAERFGVTKAREVRKASGKKMKDVVAASGLSSPYISNLERGKYRATQEQVDKLAAALEVDASAILDDK